MNKKLIIAHIALPLLAAVLALLYFADFAEGGTWAWQSVGHGFNGPVYSVLWNANASRLYAGGDFAAGGGNDMRRLAYWTAAGGWTNMTANDVVRALAAPSAGSTIYIGGDFTSLGAGTLGTAANYVGYYAPSTGEFKALGDGLDAACHSLAYDPSGSLYAGLAASNYPQKWDGESWANYTTSSGRCNALGVDSAGRIYAVGGLGTAMFQDKSLIGEADTGEFFAIAFDAVNDA